MGRMTIELPGWARIGDYVLVRDYDCSRGPDPKQWYKERIIAFGYDGVFHQEHNCPVYYTKFSEYGNTIKSESEGKDEVQ